MEEDVYSALYFENEIKGWYDVYKNKKVIFSVYFRDEAQQKIKNH